MARALSQSHLHRCVEQAEAAAILCNEHCWLSAIVVARSLLETIAAYHHLARKIANLVRAGNIRATNDALLTASFATRDPELINQAGSDDVRATSILTQIDALASHHAGVRQDYDLLSEHAHPNAFGVFLFFSQESISRTNLEFRTEGWIAGKAFIMIGASISALHAALDASQTMEAAAQELSQLGQRSSTN
jgi:hypothetical protein